MKHLIPSLLLVLLLCTAATQAQDGVASIVLKSGERLSGVVLAVSDASVIIQPNLEQYNEYYWAHGDISAICDGAFAVPFTEIDSLYLERSSSSWLIGFPLVPIVLSIGLAAVLGATANPDGFGGGSFAVAVGAAAGLMLGTVFGIPVAIALHANYGSDFWVKLADPDDMAAMRAAAVFPDSIPPYLQALE